ncbi:MAG: hypothetical protein E6968_05265 [Peptostreptococcaceae bacterium]|nr:hypothetical protein [Peptostreptococcaceae bacterium]
MDKTAAILNIPYIIWMVFVIFLSYFIWVLNK